MALPDWRNAERRIGFGHHSFIRGFHSWMVSFSAKMVRCQPAPAHGLTILADGLATAPYEDQEAGWQQHPSKGFQIMDLSRVDPKFPWKSVLRILFGVPKNAPRLFVNSPLLL